ncbi:hypothetical protein SASPL_118816 [Salvia splendens]|uniref:Uncharacterized protein n=1 Tax=Salvia splendens TaxID=180675 RepID=A0A8X8Y323_SALSN|nr:hypothetical protein SASPL_118816 [Salvia splendens]
MITDRSYNEREEDSRSNALKPSANPSQLGCCASNGVSFSVFTFNLNLNLENAMLGCSVLAASLAFCVFIKQVQIPAQEVAVAIPVSISRHESDYLATTDDGLRKMLTQVFIDSAILRKQADFIICCGLDTAYISR